MRVRPQWRELLGVRSGGETAPSAKRSAWRELRHTRGATSAAAAVASHPH